MGDNYFNGFSASHRHLLVLTFTLIIGCSHHNDAAATVSPLTTSPTEDDGRIINLDQGDPTMYEKFWKQTVGDRATVVIPSWEFTSYFSDSGSICWFLEPQLARQIVRLHRVVGNAVTDGRHIVIGTGSTQLFLAVLYALCPQNVTDPVSVVSMAPYYSSYPTTIDSLRSGLFRWAGDASKFESHEPFVEFVTSPNNPDGFTRHPVVNRTGGFLVHDLAYYWPQYTSITSPSDHDITLFTVSKSTGHAGIRIGWALVKDAEVARKMTKFIELSSLGVSKDSQLRATKIMEVVSSDAEEESRRGSSLFEYGLKNMRRRWKMLRAAVKKSGGMFSLPDYRSEFCSFNGRSMATQPAFAWVKCEGDVDDCEEVFKKNKILTRSGTYFGASPKYVRISMIDRDENFVLFIRRLSNF
ncbi:Tryptophan aminotransferase-related protein 2 [Linum grandiflorum]